MYIPQQIKDLIILMYAKPIMIKAKCNNEFKYVLYCSATDTWDSITSRILETHGVSAAFYYIKNFQHLNGNVDRYNWQSLTHLWTEHDTFEFKLSKLTTSRREAYDYFSKLNIMEQLTQSIPDKVSIDHMTYKLSVENIQPCNRKEYMRNVIVTNDINGLNALNLDAAVNNKEDWKQVLHDVCIYYFIECNLQNKHSFKFEDIQFKDAKRNSEWREHLSKKCSSIIELQPQHQIYDSILGYHHYTIAISHIIKVYQIFKGFYYKLSVAFIIE
eukprot:537573_1